MSKLVLLVENIKGKTLTTPIDILTQGYKETGRYVEQWCLQEKHEMANLVKNHIEFQNINEIENFDPNTKYAYYVPLNLFFEMPPLNLFQIMSQSTYEKIVNNNITLLISFQLDMFDPTVTNHFINKFYDWSRYHMWCGIHRNKTIFLTGCKLDDGFNQFLHESMPNYRFLHSPLLLFWSKFGLQNNNISCFEVLNNYLDKGDKKLYTHLNKSGRIHRYTLLHGLRANNLLGDSITSNVHDAPLDTNQFREIIDQKHYDNLRNNLIYSYQDLLLRDMSRGSIGQILLDVDNSSPHSFVNWNYKPNWFTDSCFDIVGETGSYYDKTQWLQFTILSEKIAKTMYNFKPFMINGGHGSLKLLKDFGFETWPEVFDESYDNETNMIERQRIIVENVQKWQHRKEEFMDIIRQNKNKLLHNHNHLLNFDAEKKLYDTLIPHI